MGQYLAQTETTTPPQRVTAGLVTVGSIFMAMGLQLVSSSHCIRHERLKCIPLHEMSFIFPTLCCTAKPYSSFKTRLTHILVSHLSQVEFVFYNHHISISTHIVIYYNCQKINVSHPLSCELLK